MTRRTFTAIIFTMALLPITGCTDADRTQRAEWLRSQIAASEARVAELAPIIQALETQWLDLRAKLSDPNNSEESQAIGGQMKEVETELGRAKPALDAAKQVAAVAKTELDRILADGTVTPGEEIGAVGKGVTAVGTAVGGPWGAIIAAAGMAISAIGTAAVRGRMAKTEVQAAEAEAKALAARDAAIAQGAYDQMYELARKTEEAKKVAEIAITGIVGSVSAMLDPKNGILADEKQVEAAKSVLARAQTKVPEAAAAVRKVLDAAKPEKKAA